MKVIRFNDARLHAVLSKNIYSEQGLEAFILPPSGQVCHSFIVVSYCTPGSAQAHAAKEISSHTLEAGILPIAFPFVLDIRSHSPSFLRASKNLFGILTELFEF